MEELTNIISLINRGAMDCAASAVDQERISNTIDNHHDHPTPKVKHLPDELLLGIISLLDASDERDMKTLKAFGLVCHRFRELAHDYELIKKMMAPHKHILNPTIFTGTIWTPRTLSRYSKLVNQSTQCCEQIWSIWSTIHHSQFLPITCQTTLLKGITAFLELDGIEDNRPQYYKFNEFPKSTIVSMLAAALVYQEVFMSRYFVLIPGLPYHQCRQVIRSVLRYVFLTKGPQVAMRILDNPVAHNTATVEYAIIDDIARRYLQPGQQLILTGMTKDGGNISSVNWTMENAIANWQRDLSRATRSAHRIDLKTSAMVIAMIRDWRWHDFDIKYFRPSRKKRSLIKKDKHWSQDLINCLHAWRQGNPLL